MAKHDPYDVFGFDDARSLRNLLEDIEVIGQGDYLALISAHHVDTDVRGNVRAALLAAKLDLSSIDYTRKRYVDDDSPDEDTGALPLVKKYIAAYYSCKNYIATMHKKTSSMNDDTRHWGAFAASVALSRLDYSFFSAHLLYQLGHKYEAHAVSRQIFEQIAWADAASQLDSLNDIKRLVTTKCVRSVRTKYPGAGELYGMLSRRVHLDSQSHTDFLRIENGVGVIHFTRPDYFEFALVMLILTDLFGVVWESSQASYIKDFEATMVTHGAHVPRENRPFLEVMRHHLAELKPENAAFETTSSSSTETTGF